MVKKAKYLLFILIITTALLEVTVRFLTSTNDRGVDLFLGQDYRYLLPLPSSLQDCVGKEEMVIIENQYRIFDDTLGWSHGSWGLDTSAYPLYANNRGARIGKVNYLARKEATSHYDIITIGNSFTHGDAVSHEESWAGLIEEKSGRTVCNLGVGGYGLQQALLRLMISGMQADTVIFGAIWGDFERAVEPVYNFYQGGTKTKPIMHFNSSTNFELINVPVLTPYEFCQIRQKQTHQIFKLIPAYSDAVFSDAIWTKSYFLRLIESIGHHKEYFKEKPIYLEDSNDLYQCVSIFKLFKTYCEANGMYPKVVLLDSYHNFRHKEKWDLENPWYLVEQKLQRLDIDYVDFHSELYTAFQKKHELVIHPIEGIHYSPSGNKIVADLLAADLGL